MFHLQRKVMGVLGAAGRIQDWKKEEEQLKDKVKKNEEVVHKLEKKREQYEGELCEML